MFVATWHYSLQHIRRQETTVTHARTLRLGAAAPNDRTEFAQTAVAALVFLRAVVANASSCEDPKRIMRLDSRGSFAATQSVSGCCEEAKSHTQGMTMNCEWRRWQQQIGGSSVSIKNHQRIYGNLQTHSPSVRNHVPQMRHQWCSVHNPECPYTISIDVGRKS